VDMEVPTEESSVEGGAPVRAWTCAWSFWICRQVELVVRAEESLAAAGAEVAVGKAVERRGCAAGGLSKEDTVRLSKLTLGREIKAEATAGEETSQEKVILSMSRQVDSFAEMGFLRASSHPIDSAMATAALENRL